VERRLQRCGFSTSRESAAWGVRSRGQCVSCEPTSIHTLDPATDTTLGHGDATVPASDRAYWEARLRQRYTLGGVGWIGLGESYNRWLYRVRRNVFMRMVSPLLSQTIRVVDVGSGTGFYVDLWRRLGAGSISGSDMTEVAVLRLSERFAPIEFHRYELGAGQVPAFGEVDVVSAMDVLFHIVDDEQYRRALKELGSILRPGGHLVLTENVAPDEEQRARRQVSRTRHAITAALRDAGLTLVACRPMFVLMNTPVGDRSRLAERWWRMVHTVVARGERAGAVGGALLYPAELVATRLRRTGPSTQILVCRKAGAPTASRRQDQLV
jgi:SAM-dependent methyltransferase